MRLVENRYDDHIQASCGAAADLSIQCRWQLVDTMPSLRGLLTYRPNMPLIKRLVLRETSVSRSVRRCILKRF
jgi:hypothetical protein